MALVHLRFILTALECCIAWVHAELSTPTDDSPIHGQGLMATGRKKFVLAGLWTEACVMFPALDMLNQGYEIYIPADACGDLSLEAHNRAMDRAVQAGAIPITSFQYVLELQQDWARTETYEGVMNILRAHSPYGIQVR
jgi:nicotinamidase-related amidase